MGYEIRIVSNEEFDTLPYKGAKSALGLADERNGIAYVRETGVRELDESTINHEFDELLMKVSPHEEDGIRYKGGGGIISFIVEMIAGAINPFLGAAVSAGRAAHQTTGGAMGGGDERETKGQFWRIPISGAQNFTGSGGFGKMGSAWELGGKAAKAASAGLGAAQEIPTAIEKKSVLPVALGGLSGYGKASGAAGVKQLGSKLFGEGAKEAAKATVTGAGDVALSSADLAAQGATGSGLTGAALPLSSSGAGASTGAGLTGALANAPLQAAAPVGQSLLSKFGNFAKKSATDYVKSAGKNFAVDTTLNAFAPQQEQPGTLFPEKRTPAGGSSPLGGFNVTGGANSLSIFNEPLSLGTGYEPISQQEYDTGIGNIVSAKQKNISQLFRNFRGQTPEGNTALANQLSKLNTGYTNSLAQYNTDIDAANLSREYNAVKQQNKLTDEQMGRFIDIAGLDDAAISQQISGNTPDEIRQIFGRLKKIA